MTDKEGFSKIVTTGDTIILDVGRTGCDFYERIDDIIANDENYGPQLAWVSKFIYERVLGDLVRIMGYSPEIVIQQLHTFPYTDVMEDVIAVLMPETYNKLIQPCQEYLLKIYLDLTTFKRIQMNGEIDYIPVQIGYDYIVVREVITQWVKVISDEQ